VASLVALGPCHVTAQGTTAAGTLLGILGLGHVGAEAQRLKGTAAKSTVNLNTATLAELEKLPGVGETTAKKIVAGRPYKAVADLSKARVSAKTIGQITPLVSVGEAQVPAALGSSASSPAPSGAPASSIGRASDSVKFGSVRAPIPPTKGMVWANVKSGVFHRDGDRWYGKTEQGKFMTEAEARKAGYRPAEEGAAGKKSASRAPG
jgi:NAD-dependent DNA ligase